MKDIMESYRLHAKRREKLIRWSPYLVLLGGAFWIYDILNNPPVYYLWRNGLRITDDTRGLYPTPDMASAGLHAVGAAVVIAVVYYVVKKWVSSQGKQ
jgi:hypothetical protein